MLTCITGEVIGYVTRSISATQENGEWTLGPFVTQAVLLLVAPALFAASVYMQLGRIVKSVEGEKYLFVRRTWLTKIFVAGDVISFCLQGGGGGLESGRTAQDVTTGANLVVGGLFVQIVFFGLFVLAAMIFDIKFQKQPVEKYADVPYRRNMIALYVISILIFVRSIVRVVEFLQGYGGYVMAHEAFLYVFDAMPMWFCVVAAFIAL
jgi:RTA1 like protein